MLPEEVQELCDSYFLFSLFLFSALGRQRAEDLFLQELSGLTCGRDTYITR